VSKPCAIFSEVDDQQRKPAGVYTNLDCLQMELTWGPETSSTSENMAKTIDKKRGKTSKPATRWQAQRPWIQMNTRENLQKTITTRTACTLLE
jgi:hypothetical protein